jgi:hypothetical protein
MPLQVCFAETIHTFQGSNTGSVSVGQQEPPIQKLALDIETWQLLWQVPFFMDQMSNLQG